MTLWTQDQIYELANLWREGKSATTIAKHFNCTRNAVCGKLHRLGLNRKEPALTPSTPSAPLPALPTAVAPPPTFGASPQGQKPKAKNTTATFLGSADLPSPGNLAGKQLVGQ